MLRRHREFRRRHPVAEPPRRPCPMELCHVPRKVISIWPTSRCTRAITRQQPPTINALGESSRKAPPKAARCALAGWPQFRRPPKNTDGAPKPDGGSVGLEPHELRPARSSRNKVRGAAARGIYGPRSKRFRACKIGVRSLFFRLFAKFCFHARAYSRNSRFTRTRNARNSDQLVSKNREAPGEHSGGVWQLPSEHLTPVRQQKNEHLC